MTISKLVYKELKAIIRVMLMYAIKRPSAAKFMLKTIFFQLCAIKKRSKYEKEGTHIPPFLIMSITAKCNLSCTGCYSSSALHKHNFIDNEEMSKDDFDRLFFEAEKIGLSTIMLAGGEPLIRRDILETAAEHKKILFTVYTNSTMLDDDYIKFFKRNRHLLLVFSLEGGKKETDGRRGEGIYSQIMEKIRKVNEQSMLFGVSLTATAENISTITDRSFIRRLRGNGCRYINIVEFEDVDDKNGHLKLSKIDRKALFEHVELYKKEFKDIFFSSNPSLEYQTNSCLAAGKGFFHINAFGDAEPCNFIPCSDTNIKGHSLIDALRSPLFIRLAKSGILTDDCDGECALMVKKKELKELIDNDPAITPSDFSVYHT